MITVINYNTHKSTSDAIGKKGGEVNTGEDDIVYENPDRTATTTTPGRFNLTECSVYVATTASTPQSLKLQSGYYVL